MSSSLKEMTFEQMEEKVRRKGFDIPMFRGSDLRIYHATDKVAEVKKSLKKELEKKLKILMLINKQKRRTGWR